MSLFARCSLAILSVLAFANVAPAQLAPSIGYMHPSGVQAGQSTEVVLGGYDWTPDMQLFVHDPRIILKIVDKPGPVIVPEPPYWFGKKARRGPFRLPRETRALLTVPAGVKPGLVKWQAANANGATAVGTFAVSDHAEQIEPDDTQAIQQVAALPVTLSGRIKKIEEVDRYQFTSPHDGPITCLLASASLGSELTAVLEIHNAQGELVAHSADTTASGAVLTFRAAAKEAYTISLYDLDFRGNRAFVYRLSLLAAPHVTAAYPPSGKRGTTQNVQFTGYGIATGSAKLETVNQSVAFPADAQATSFGYSLQTKFGLAPAIELHLSDRPIVNEDALADRRLTAPLLACGFLSEKYAPDIYRFTAVKGQSFAINAYAEAIGSPLDLSLVVLDAEGAELATADDSKTSLDPELAFRAKADGEYQLHVFDNSGQGGSTAAVYQLAFEEASPGFEISAPEMFAAPIAGKASLALTVVRLGGFNDPIPVTLEGLPPGVSIPENLEIAAKQRALKIELTVGEKAAAAASLVRITATAKIDEQELSRTTDPILLAITIAPPFSIDAEGKDDVTKWPRGTTFPAPVLIERNEGFQNDIMLEMSSKQGRHRQGIAGPELTVGPGVSRIEYPVFLPEWLETTRTSRMIVNGVAQVADPQGNVRYSLVKQKTRMGFLPTGALLKLSAGVSEIAVSAGESLTVPLTISRAQELTQPLTLSLHAVSPETGAFTATEITLAADQTEAVFPVRFAGGDKAESEYQLTLRASTTHGGLPVASDAIIVVLPR